MDREKYLIIGRKVFDFRIQEEKYRQSLKTIYRSLMIFFRSAEKIRGRISPAPRSKLFLRDCSDDVSVIEAKLKESSKGTASTRIALTGLLTLRLHQLYSSFSRTSRMSLREENLF